MSGNVGSLNRSRFPLIEDRAKPAKLVGLMLVGRLLRDIVVPANSGLGRSVYAGALAGVMLYLLARPGVTRVRASLWAILGGMAIAAVISV